MGETQVMANTEELKTIATQVRRDIVRMVHAVSSGHPGGSLGCADYFTALFVSRRTLSVRLATRVMYLLG